MGKRVSHINTLVNLDRTDRIKIIFQADAMA